MSQQAGELSMTDESSVGCFFDSLSAEYTAVIERCFPRYREMLWALLAYLPTDRTFRSVLELGGGTGNLSILLSETFCDAAIRLVDVSRESIDVCRLRLGNGERFVFQVDDFRDLDFDPGSFDLIISSIAVHHLRSDEKKTLFQQAHKWLTPSGLLSFADQVRGATEDLYARHQALWKEQSLAAGASAEEFAMWMEHQRDHDHHDSLKDQFDWLCAAGFTVVDCPWRYLLWSVIQARKDESITS